MHTFDASDKFLLVLFFRSQLIAELSELSNLVATFLDNHIRRYFLFNINIR
jgi:hypothetical protein